MAAKKGTSIMKDSDYSTHEMKDSKGRSYPKDDGPARQGMKMGTGSDEGNPHRGSKAIEKLFRSAGRPNPNPRGATSNG